MTQPLQRVRAQRLQCHSSVCAQPLQRVRDSGCSVCVWQNRWHVIAACDAQPLQCVYAALAALWRRRQRPQKNDRETHVIREVIYN
jgi:hypothetical protein